MSIIKTILNLYNKKNIDANLLFIKEVSNYTNTILGKGYRSIGNEDEVKKLKSFLKSEITNAVDAGANYGQYSESLLNNFKIENLYIFEPSATCIKELKLKFLNKENIKIINKGLSDKKELAPFYGEYDGDEGSSLYRRNLDHINVNFIDLGRIQLIKFDTFWEEVMNKEIIDIYKLDIEGNELSALRGSKNALVSTKVVQFEFGAASIDSKNYFRDYFYFFKELNFELYRMRPQSLIKIKKYSESDEDFSHSNFIAVNNNFFNTQKN